MVITSRSELWGAMWSFQDHGSTHEAVFGRERPPGYRWLLHIQPSPPPPSIIGPPMLELLDGSDTVTQITALSGWLQRRQASP